MPPAQLHLFPIRVSRLAIYLSTFISIAWSAAINIPYVSLTTSIAANSNHCTDSHTWIGTGTTAIDCIGAVQSLYNSEVKSFSDVDFEFLSGTAPRRSLPAMRTPRKYTHGKCPDILPTKFVSTRPKILELNNRKEHAPSPS